MDLAQEFEHDMREGVRKCREFGYVPTLWIRMMSEHGAVGAAKHLLHGTRASDGFTRLWEEGRLDLSVEFVVLWPKYADLFTGAERAEARRRLEMYEFDVDRALASHSSTAASDASQVVPPAPSVAESSSPPIAESPVVAPVAATEVTGAERPSLDDLKRARELFGVNEPRDVFYRVATYLVAKAIEGDAPISLPEAISVLLQTWNRAYYQYHPVGADHYEQLDHLLHEHDPWLKSVRGRSIATLVPDDEVPISRVFEEFEIVLGPVGAAKALHLLAPGFLPLWDRAIAVAYGLELGPTGTNRARYVRLTKIAQEQAARLVGAGASRAGVLKAIDEYNYCRFTKGWM